MVGIKWWGGLEGTPREFEVGGGISSSIFYIPTPSVLFPFRMVSQYHVLSHVGKAWRLGQIGLQPPDSAEPRFAVGNEASGKATWYSQSESQEKQRDGQRGLGRRGKLLEVTSPGW